MDERDKTERGVIFAATLLQLICVPFILATLIGVIAVFFFPFTLAIGILSNAPSRDNVIVDGLQAYAVCMVVLIIFYIVSTGMMMMAEMMKVNCLETKGRQFPKSHLCKLVDNLLVLIGLELLFGGIFGMAGAFIRTGMMKQSHHAGEAVLFLAIILVAAIGVFSMRKYLMKMSWWCK